MKKVLGVPQKSCDNSLAQLTAAEVDAVDGVDDAPDGCE